MDKCSYTWNEWNKKRGKFVKKECLEEIWENSEEYCIFHDPSQDKDTRVFEQKLQKKLDNKDYDFRGYHFPKDIDFSSREFKKDACFDGTVFKNAYFNRTVFQYVSFLGAVIEQNLDFVPRQLDQLNLQNTKFLSKGHITADMSQTIFYRAELDAVTFLDCEWPEKLYEETHMGDEGRTFKELETIYRNLKQNMYQHGDYLAASKFFYREMEMRRKGAKAKKELLWLEVYRLLAGYGEHPLNTISVSGLIVLLFALVYWGLGCLQYTVENPPLFQQIVDAVYFSFVTFTTLGLGDIRPLNNAGKVLICCEALIGAFLIALFVVVFVRKMAR